jgi:glutamyl-tRNA(Gln) amidotransferase subunit D
MYSEKVAKALKEAKAEIGHRVVVEKAGKRFEGLLMPKAGSSDPDSIAIKLDNGYNIGVKFDHGVKITRSHGKEPKEVVEEERVEMGKVKKSLMKVEFDKNKPQVSIITTGGTITSRVDYKSGGVTTLMSPEEMVHNVPEIAKFAKLKMESPFSIMSESMTHEHWQKIAVEVAKELHHSEGVIVTHGTDTLHYTAAVLSFMLPGLGKPVVLVGSQRSTDRGSSDGSFNLICGARVALSDMAAVGVCMHGDTNDGCCIFTRGTKVRKMHTSRRDAFRPINEQPLAKVWPDGRIEKLQDIPKRNGDVPKPDTAFEPKVAIVKSYPGSDPGVIDHYVDKGYRGIVILATGLGQVPTHGKGSWLGSVKNAVERGVVVCGAADTIYGRLNPNVYTEGRMIRDAGLVHLEDMLAETAYVKLGWVLGHTKKPEEAIRMMLTNYAGEITPRSGTEDFTE